MISTAHMIHESQAEEASSRAGSAGSAESADSAGSAMGEMSELLADLGPAPDNTPQSPDVAAQEAAQEWVDALRK